MENNSYLNILKENGYSEKKSNDILFIPEIDEEHWYVERWQIAKGDRKVANDKRRSYEDDILFVVNRVFRTEIEALAYHDFLLSEAELKIAITKINNGWIPDWVDSDQQKYYIYYSHSNNRFVIDYNYFTAKKDSKEQCLLYLKDTKSAQYIINNYEKQLKTYFGISDEQ